MRLLAVRDLNEQDPLPGLGTRKRPAPVAAEVPVSKPLAGHPDILVGPDGKWETQIKKNEGARWKYQGTTRHQFGSPCSELLQNLPKSPLEQTLEYIKGLMKDRKSFFEQTFNCEGTVTGRMSCESASQKARAISYSEHAAQVAGATRRLKSSDLADLSRDCDRLAEEMSGVTSEWTEWGPGRAGVRPSEVKPTDEVALKFRDGSTSFWLSDVAPWDYSGIVAYRVVKA